MNVRSILARTLRRLEAGLTARRLPLYVGLLAGALLLPALWAGFQLDDHFQRAHFTTAQGADGLRVFEFYRGDSAADQLRRETGALPWWAAPNFRHSLLRQVSAATMQLDYLLWPSRPDLMHLHSLLWLCALAACAASFYRELLGRAWPAGLAALLYAIDDAHALPVTYLANRNAVVACCFGVLSLWSYARWRRHGPRGWGLLSLISLALALGAGELGVATAGYLAAHALFIDRASIRERLLALTPSAVLLVGWVLLYRARGYGAQGSGYYHDPASDPLAFAASCLAHIPPLLLGQWTPIPAEFAVALPRAVPLVVVVLLAVLLYPLVRRDATARFFAAGALFSLLPIAAVGPMNRLLFFVGLGSMGLLSLGLRALFVLVRDRARSGFARASAVALASLLLGAHGVLAPVLGLATVEYQNQVSEAARRAVATVPHDPQIAQQDLVLLNPPDYVYAGMAIAPVKRLEGRPVARRLRALAPTASRMLVVRSDERTLEATLAPGLFSDDLSRYFRSEAVRFHVGERIELPGLGIEVLSLNAHGDPDRLRYHFEHALEHPSLRWLQWHEGSYVAWQPPAIGQSVELLPQKSLFEVATL